MSASFASTRSEPKLIQADHCQQTSIPLDRRVFPNGVVAALEKQIFLKQGARP